MTPERVPVAHKAVHGQVRGAVLVNCLAVIFEGHQVYVDHLAKP